MCVRAGIMVRWNVGSQSFLIRCRSEIAALAHQRTHDLYECRESVVDDGSGVGWQWAAATVVVVDIPNYGGLTQILG